MTTSNHTPSAADSSIDDHNPWSAWDADHLAQRGAIRALNGPLRIAFYGRCSTEDNQDPETSRQWQLRAARSVIDVVAPGAQIVAEFFDIGESRSIPWKRRPEAARLLAEVTLADRGWDAIVVGEGRRCWFGSQFDPVAEIVQHYGVPLLIPEVGGFFDPQNSTHHLLMGISGGLSRGERQAVQVRTKTGMAAQVEQQGRYQGGRPPFGYVAVGVGPHPNPRKAAEGFQEKRLAVDEVAAPVVQRIFAALLGGASLRTIARDLNTDGVPCPSAHDPSRNTHRSGDGWQQTTVRSIITNQRYTGFEVWGKFHKEESLLDPSDPALGHQTRLVRSKDPVVRSARQVHPELVSVADWVQAQAELAGRSAGGLKEQAKTTRNRAGATPRALRGLVVCVHCGRKMQAESRAQRDPMPPREDGQVRPGRKATPDRAKVTRYRCRRRDLVEGSPVWEDHPSSIVVAESLLLDGVQVGLSGLFGPEHVEETLDALTADLAVPSIATLRRKQTEDRLADAERRLSRLIDSIEAGTPATIITPRIEALQHEITTLRSALPSADESKPSVTRDDVVALIEFVAPNLDEVFGPRANPKDLHDFFTAIGLRIEFDGVARTAQAEVHLSQKALTPLSEIERGVSERVRGGT